MCIYIDIYIYIYWYIYIYLWSPPTPRGDSSPWGWVHYARQLNSQYDNMFKNTANTIPIIITAWIHMTWNILTSQKEKITISWKQNLFLKKVIFSSNCTPFCMKNAPDPSKSCIASKKCHMREENQQTTQTISKHKWTNALGFELQSASNLHRDKKQQKL